MRPRDVRRFQVVALLFIAALSTTLGACGGTTGDTAGDTATHGTFVYVANWGSGTVMAWTMGTDNTLTPLDVRFAGFPKALAADPQGAFLFVASSSNPGSGLTAGTENSVYRFSILPDGSLASLGTPTPTGENPLGIIVHPSGSFAYVATVGAVFGTGDNVYAYRINRSTGALDIVGVVPSGLRSQFDDAIGMAFDPDGKFLYVSNNFAGTVSAYGVDAATGALAEIAGSPFPLPSATTWPEGIVSVRKTGGSFLYVANESLVSEVLRFRISPDNGALTYVDNVVAFDTLSGDPITPDQLATDPAGDLLFVTSDKMGSVISYTVGNDGALTYSGQYSTSGLANPEGAMVDPTGNFLFVADSKDEPGIPLAGDIFVYPITGGTLTGGLSYNSPGTTSNPYSLFVIRK